MKVKRKAIGADITPGTGTHFRVWAPKCSRVEVVLEGNSVATVLKAEEGGFFAGIVEAARAGSLYRFRLDGKAPLYPDPASRFQPEGPHGPSQVVDPHTFAWTDATWRGVPREGQVLYEIGRASCRERV